MEKTIKTPSKNINKKLNKRIHVIGLGISDVVTLNKENTAVLSKADLIIGSKRQLDVVEQVLSEKQKTVHLPKLDQLKVLLDENKNKQLVILASGDPLFYGIGNWLMKHLDKKDIHFHPAVSSIQGACHLIGVSLQEVDVLSLHGRPLEKIRTILKSQQKLMVLTDQYSQPKQLAQECMSAGYTNAEIWVCENIGYPTQKVSRFSVKEILEKKNLSFSPLHVSMIETHDVEYQADSTISYLPEFPGIPDEHYITGKEPGKGMITKREVRLSILSLMQPSNKDIIWDIGAGCGGVSVELAYWNEETTVYAIEDNKQRLDCLEQNRQRFGVVSNLHIVPHRAPSCLGELQQANKIFIGGSGDELANLLLLSWWQLPYGGLLVASAVTESSRNIVFDFLKSLKESLKDDDNESFEYETLQIAVSKGEPLAGELMYKPNLPVTLYKIRKINVKD